MRYIIFFLIASIPLFAQQPIQVTYETIRTFPESFFQKVPEEMRKGMKEQFAKPLYNQLTNYGIVSIYKSLNSKEAHIPGIASSDLNKIDLGIIVPVFDEWKYKDYTNQKITKRVVVQDKSYYIEEKLIASNLIFAKGDTYIDKYKCKYAYELSAKNVADTIKYWYAPDIAIDDCPSNQIGFPGLVLKKQSLNSTTYAIKIAFLKEDSKSEILDMSIPIITLDDYKKMKSSEGPPKSVQSRIEGIKQNSGVKKE